MSDWGSSSSDSEQEEEESPQAPPSVVNEQQTGFVVDEQRATTVLTSIQKSWGTGLYTDITVVVKGRRFMTHQLVLASLSDYFPPLLKMDERPTGEVIIQGVDPDMFELLLKYAYSGEITITSDNVQVLLMTADFFGVSFVKSKCEQYIASNLDPENFCNVLTFSLSLNLGFLQHSAWSFLKQNLEEVTLTEGYPLLQPEVVANFLDSDDMLLYSNSVVLRAWKREKMVFTAACRYLKAQQSPPSDSLVEKIIRCVRLCDIAPSVVEEVLNDFDDLAKHPVVNEYLKLGQVVKEVKDKMKRMKKPQKYKSTVSGLEGVPKKWWNPRKLVIFRITHSKRRYPTAGYVAYFSRPPPFTLKGPGVELCRVDVWIRRWDDRPVIGHMVVTHRPPGAQENPVPDLPNHSGEHFSAILEPGEYIVKVVIGSGYVIDRIGFTTNKGRELGPFGGPGGSEYVEEPREATVGVLSLYDINFELAETQDEDAVLNLMLRWVEQDYCT